MTNPFPPPSSASEKLQGLRLLSGIGEELGLVLGVEHDKFGHPKWLSFQEQGAAAPRRVRLDFVRGVTGDSVVLAGPREGYHITRVMRDPEE